ncbi:hypothetical protein D046_0063A, partial [Vibrio parahaemolyticus V-223/04]
MKPLGT